MGANLHELYVFLATRQLYFSCVVKCCILICWQNKAMMMMMYTLKCDYKNRCDTNHSQFLKLFFSVAQCRLVHACHRTASDCSIKRVVILRNIPRLVWSGPKYIGFDRLYEKSTTDRKCSLDYSNGPVHNSGWPSPESHGYVAHSASCPQPWTIRCTPVGKTKIARGGVTPTGGVSAELRPAFQECSPAGAYRRPVIN